MSCYTVRVLTILDDLSVTDDVLFVSDEDDCLMATAVQSPDLPQLRLREPQRRLVRQREQHQVRVRQVRQRAL